mmetsp:Transcript_36606/g.56017  ORF Transcript_36606/g.56017 Transcript_36606/m.56017 type:complete len:198 (-) Transcript_36606:43-636(-)
MVTLRSSLLTLVALATLSSCCHSFTIHSPRVKTNAAHSIVTFLSSEDDDTSSPEGEEEEPIFESVVRINDGGSDLTDRFKYKVNALMGTYDPAPGVANDENTDGNILNAMLNFPTSFTFTVVGKTMNDDELTENYTNKVKQVIIDNAGGDENSVECRITPRGKNFTRITMVVTVESSGMINNIYKELEEIEGTVMRF